MGRAVSSGTADAVGNLFGALAPVFEARATHMLGFAAALLSLLLLAKTSAATAPTGSQPLVVASKKFPESTLLAEILAQALEQRGVRVERRMNLGNTAVAFEALERGSIDVYPEYSGTALGLMNVDRSRALQQPVSQLLRRLLAQRHSLFWGPELGFNNSYALAVPEAFAKQHELQTLSDLARHSQQRALSAAFSHEFLAREDGYRPLAKRYGLKLTTRGTEHGVAYQLIASGKVDTIDVYSTEGLIAEHKLRVLADDAHFFPPYAAAFMYGPRVAENPAAIGAINDLSGTLSDERMRKLNHALEVESKPLANVARGFWGSTTQGGTNNAPAGVARKRLSFWQLVVVDRDVLLGHLRRHLELTLLAMLLCVAIGVPLGYAASRSTLGATLSLGVSGILQTIPSLALLVLAIPLAAMLLTPLGQGNLALEAAALLSMFFYSLLPVVRNTKEGLVGINPAIIEAATGTGMTPRQVLCWVKLPLALPVILAGVRTAFVITIGTATLAAFVGAGGLGVPIISGLSIQNFTEVWTGAVPAALLALVSDALFSLVQKRLTQKMAGARGGG
jgi:osmoprotectant transport system permease protein